MGYGPEKSGVHSTRSRSIALSVPRVCAVGDQERLSQCGGLKEGLEDNYNTDHGRAWTDTG